MTQCRSGPISEEFRGNSIPAWINPERANSTVGKFRGMFDFRMGPVLKLNYAVVGRFFGVGRFRRVPLYAGSRKKLGADRLISSGPDDPKRKPDRKGSKFRL